MEDIQVKHHQDITNHRLILLVKLQVTHLKVDILLKVIHSSQAVIQQDLLELHQEGIQVLHQVTHKLHLWAIQEPKVLLQALHLVIHKVLLLKLHLVIHKVLLLELHLVIHKALHLALLLEFISHMVNLQSSLQFEQVFR